MPLPYKYKFLDHPSDIKIRAYGNSLAEVFINSALGMMAYIYGEKPIKIEYTEEIKVFAKDPEELLINWLAEILASSAINHRIYFSFSIKEITSNKIIAEVGSAKAQVQEEIKAVTYHELSLKQIKNHWVTTVVYDI